MSTGPSVGTDPRYLSRIVSVHQMFHHLGWRIRRRNRADCGLCRGHSTGTVSFTDRLWKCHRCGAGGDVFTLVQAVQHCGFRDALRFVADLGGVTINESANPDIGHQLAVRRRKRERVDTAAEILENLERAQRIECRNQIHCCDSVLEQPSPWNETQWRRAQGARMIRDEFLLPEYTLLAFGKVSERIRYVLANHLVRTKVVTAIRAAGGIKCEGDHWVEVIGS